MNEIKAFTDLGNAERISEREKHEIRYCKDIKRWLFWIGIRWQVDETGEINRRIQQAMKSIYEEVKYAEGDASLIEKIRDHARKSQAYGKINAAERLARTAAEFQVSLDKLDANPMLLNCPNGTVELESGRLRPHSRNDLITRLVPVEYDKKAQCPTWMAFLKKIMAGDNTMIAYLQKIIGYSLSGRVDEQCLFILSGHGANGKSTLLETVRKMLGDYARHTPSCTLLANNMAIRNDLARLRGARFVSAVEIGIGKKLDEALVKQLTGGDPITSRFLFQEYFEHRPSFKLFMAVNHLPEIRGVDHGIWRRLHLVPFKVVIKEEEMDRGLVHRLESELPGILAWAVQGCLEWQKNGLGMPSTSMSALHEYREETDKIADFVTDCCSQEREARVPIKTLYDTYKSWAEDNEGDALTKKSFGQYLKQKGYKQGKCDGVRFWKGLRLRSEAGEERDERFPQATADTPSQTH